MKKYRILFIGKPKDFYSQKFYFILKKNFKHVSSIFDNSINHKKIKTKIKTWKGDYIFCFRSRYILTRNDIINHKEKIVNFHPGPPEYRGIGCVNFAIMNNEKKYGVTAHLIDSVKIDRGKIIDVARWKIKNNESVDEILKKTYLNQLIQLKRIIQYIKKKKLNLLIKKSKKNQWSKKLYTRRQLNQLYQINVNKKKNLTKVLRSTVTKKFKPYILIEGKKFIYEN